MDTIRICNQWLDMNRAAMEPLLRFSQAAWQTAERVTGDRRPYDQWFDLNRAALEPFLRWNEIALGAAERLTRRNLSMAQDCIEAGVRQMNLMCEAKDQQQWEADERKLVSEFGQKLVEHAGDYLKVARETSQACKDWADEASRQAASVAQRAGEAAGAAAGQAGHGPETHRPQAGAAPAKG
jgi:hypothetical protein